MQVPEPSDPSPNAEAVDQLLQFGQRFMEDERARGQTLGATASTLAGFSGATLALTATLGAGLFDRDLGPIGPAVQGLFVAGVGMLAIGATVAIIGVLRPQGQLDISMEEIERFPEPPLITASKLDVQGRMLTTIVRTLAHERYNNARKAKLTRYAAGALVVGYGAVVAMAILFAVT